MPVVRVIESFATPKSKKIADAAFTRETRRKEAKPYHASPVPLVRLIPGLEPLGNAGGQKTFVACSVDPAEQHRRVRQLHTLRANCGQTR
jgi:hypothetical protein